MKERDSDREDQNDSRARHTARLRESYAQSAEQSRRINKEWEPLDDELWAKLDELEAQRPDF